MGVFGTCAQTLGEVYGYWEKSMEIYDLFAVYRKEKNTLKY